MASSFTPANKPITIDLANNATVLYAPKTPGPVPAVKDAATDTPANNATKFVYQYGLKNIQLTHSLYEEAGIFVTKPIDVDGNIMEVSLSTFEEHPLFNEIDGMATDRVTSIEYYISLEENPAQNEWLAILPEETKRIKSEKLFFKGASAVLRFHADISDIKQTRIYKNNIALADSDWYFTERGAAVLLSVPIELNASYTIDYVPNSALYDPWNIKVGDRFSKRVRQIDEFPNGTDMNNTVKLSKYPYVNYGLINGIDGFDPNGDAYRPFEVFLKDATMVTSSGVPQKEFFPAAYAPGSEFVTMNRTDYKNAKDAPLNRYRITPDDVNHTVEYKQQKDRLVFTESFNRSDAYYNEETNHGNATLAIHYDYLVTNFRLKVILRKNTGDELVVTPMTNSYQLKFKVMK